MKIWIYFENWNEVYDCWHVYDNDIPVGTWKVVKSSNMKQQHKHKLQVGTLYFLTFIISQVDITTNSLNAHNTHTHMHVNVKKDLIY